MNTKNLFSCRSYILAAIFALALQTSETVAATPASLVVFDDAFQNNFTYNEWGNGAFVSATYPRSYNGSYSFALNLNNFLTTFIYSTTSFTTDSYSHLEFYISGQSPIETIFDIRLTTDAYTAVGAAAPVRNYVTINSSWQKVSIPMSAFGLASGTRIQGFRVQHDAPNIEGRGNVLFDDVQFIQNSGGVTPTPTPTPTATPSSSDGVRYPSDRTQSPITSTIATNMRRILHAVSANQNINTFMKIGDSITAGPSNFFDCFSNASRVNLATHGDLQGAVDFYNQFILPDKSSSFNRVSLSAKVGMGAEFPLEGSAPPLDNEIAVVHPSIAIVMYGTNDLGNGGSSEPFTDLYRFQQYPAAMLTLIDTLIARGIVPIMSTIPPRSTDARYALLTPSFNAIVRGIAESRKVPLMDYYRELIALPKSGMAGDNLHPNSGGASPCDLSSVGLQYGYNMRNLLGLGALVRVRKILVDGVTELDSSTGLSSIALQGAGSVSSPFVVNQTMFTDIRDIATSTSSSVSGYTGMGCSDSGSAGSGKEFVYRMDVTEATPIRAFVSAHGAIDVRINLMKDSAQGSSCIRSSDTIVNLTLDPGTYYFTVDSSTASATVGSGEYMFGVFRCESGDTICQCQINDTRRECYRCANPSWDKRPECTQ